MHLTTLNISESCETPFLNSLDSRVRHRERGVTGLEGWGWGCGLDVQGVMEDARMLPLEGVGQVGPRRQETFSRSPTQPRAQWGLPSSLSSLLPNAAGRPAQVSESRLCKGRWPSLTDLSTCPLQER